VCITRGCVCMHVNIVASFLAGLLQLWVYTVSLQNTSVTDGTAVVG
jgi:hypothetical protein